MEKIKQQIHQILLENLKSITLKDLSDNVELSNLGLNSLNVVSIVLGLEKAFGIEFNMDEISYASFRTIGNIINLVKSKIRS